MKPIPFPDNSNGLYVEYHRMREGPNYFMCYYKDSSCLRQDPKDAWRVLGPAKFTQTGKDLKEWCVSMDNTYNTEELEPIPDTSFASEQEPNDNTKMIV